MKSKFFLSYKDKLGKTINLDTVFNSFEEAEFEEERLVVEGYNNIIILEVSKDLNQN